MKFAFPTDEHFPYQDDDARSVALQIVRDFDPEVLVVGSDGIDFYSLSHFNKNPERTRARSLQDEINAWVEGQKEWQDAAPNALRCPIPGNHEMRLRAWTWEHSEISSLEELEPENLMKWDQLGLTYNKGGFDANREIVLEETVAIRHGSIVRAFSAYTAKGEIEKERYSMSTITGHTHRGGSFFARTRTGVVQAHEGFCLCRLDPEYVARPDWQQGILLGTVEQGLLNVEPVLINEIRGKKHAIWRGKEYRA